MDYENISIVAFNKADFEENFFEECEILISKNLYYPTKNTYLTLSTVKKIKL
jgi:hypothetical protein